ncbi:MAG: HNH endonuclease [Desulfobacterales bacterium]|nr:MAG: HNH endonuclease [Desulfobacterales bacterium]
MDIYGFYPEEEDLRRERQKARELRKSQWWQRRRAKGICYWCGRPVAPPDLTMDHIVPVARGGKSVKGNLAPACRECNNKKKEMLPMEWEDYIQKIKGGS